MTNRRLTTVVVAVAAVIAVFVSSAPPSTAAEGQRFRLLAPSVTAAGKSRAELVIAGYTAKVRSTKGRIETSDCTKRPQFGETAPDKAIARAVFNLPARLGKTMNCTMPASSILMIDHIGVICNESKKHQASEECIAERFEDLRNYRVVVDGIDLGAQRFKVVTDQFVIDLQGDSPFGLKSGKWLLRAGGWPILLDRLAPGEHTVVTSYKLGKSKQSTTVKLTVTG